MPSHVIGIVSLLVLVLAIYALYMRRLAGGWRAVYVNETNAFSAELGLVQAQLNELLAFVQVYQALGRGWQ
jgi:outer membrane protein TolC